MNCLRKKAKNPKKLKDINEFHVVNENLHEIKN